MVDPNRKINRLTEKDIEFLDECEEEFKNRYTNDDEEFMSHCKKANKKPLPPIVEPWMNRKQNYHDGHGSGGRGGGRDGFRNNHHRGGGRYNHNRRGGKNFNRHNPYHRPDGSGSGFQRFRK